MLQAFGQAGVVGGDSAEEALARGTDHERPAQRGQLVEAAQQLEVVRGGLAEPDPRVEHDPLLRHALPHGEPHALSRNALTSSTTSLYQAHPPAASCALASMCIRQHSAPLSATTAAIAGSARNALTSFTKLAPACRAARRPPPSSVDRDLGGGRTSQSRPSPVARSPADAAQSPGENRSAPGRVDSPPVEDLRAFSRELQPVRDRSPASRNAPPSENSPASRSRSPSHGRNWLGDNGHTKNRLPLTSVSARLARTQGACACTHASDQDAAGVTRRSQRSG